MKYDANFKSAKIAARKAWKTGDVSFAHKAAAEAFGDIGNEELQYRMAWIAVESTRK